MINWLNTGEAEGVEGKSEEIEKRGGVEGRSEGLSEEGRGGG